MGSHSSTYDFRDNCACLSSTFTEILSIAIVTGFVECIFFPVSIIGVYAKLGKHTSFKHGGYGTTDGEMWRFWGQAKRMMDTLKIFVIFEQCFVDVQIA